jgi:hypothetical protein
MKIFYMGLESYQARYTFQLTDWTKRAYDKRNIDYVIVPGETIDDSEAIVTGQVLDAHGRSYFGMSQMMNLVKMLKAGEITSKDAIFFEDMFQPGMEALPYILQQTPEKYRPTIYLRCLAQAIDPDDFVHVWGMSKWMSLYEQMCNEIPNVVILASNEEMVADMIKIFKEKHPETEFAICQGGPLRSNNKYYVDEARHLEKKGLLTIHENLKKNDYYSILADSRVLFNCALQDWTSNTVSEADALGCNVLFPAYRSFPEVFSNDHTRLYVPWSQEDAMAKLELLLSKPSPSMGKISDWTDGTIDRMLDIMTGKGEQWRRDGSHYRTPVSEAKY